MTSDNRLTSGLILDVLDVLERHGYHRYDNRHTGQAIGAILDLAYVYDGTRDVSYGYYPPRASHAGPGPSNPEADDAVLTDAEVSTVVAALDIAADYKRDRAAACADCASQSCPTCQSRLEHARTYDRLAAHLIQSADASATATASDPGPARQPEPAADREAGQ
jgi:hypothetical protein